MVPGQGAGGAEGGMMVWNYRIMKREDKGQVYYQIHEAFYDDMEKEAHSWTAEPCEPLGETLAELKHELEYMLRAFEFPVLEPGAK